LERRSAGNAGSKARGARAVVGAVETRSAEIRRRAAIAGTGYRSALARNTRPKDAASVVEVSLVTAALAGEVDVGVLAPATQAGNAAIVVIEARKRTRGVAGFAKSRLTLANAGTSACYAEGTLNAHTGGASGETSVGAVAVNLDALAGAVADFGSLRKHNVAEGRSKDECNKSETKHRHG